MYVTADDGKKIAMPRYYKQKIYSENERKRIGYWTKQAEEKRQEKLAATGNIISARDKAENDKAAFAKMYHSSESGRNKV